MGGKDNVKGNKGITSITSTTKGKIKAAGNVPALKRGDIYLVAFIFFVSVAGIVIPKAFSREAGEGRVAIIRHGDSIIRKIELDKVKEAVRLVIPGDDQAKQEENAVQGKNMKHVENTEQGENTGHGENAKQGEDAVQGENVEQEENEGKWENYGTGQTEDYKAGHGDDYRAGQREGQAVNYSAVILVENGRIRFEETNCPDKTCVRTGWLEEPGDSAVCLPGRFMIKIERAEGIEGAKDEVDGVTY